MPAAPTTALDNTDEHSTTALYRAAIGDVNRAYYLPLFTRFEAADRPGLTWNWSAALYTLNWLAFRQLWHAALLYLGCAVALALSVFGIGRLVFQFSEGTQWGLLATLLVIALAVPGLGGNALLHNATRKRMQAALAASATVPEACALLARQASTRRRLIVLAALNALIAAAAAYSWVNFSGFEPLPRYADKAVDKLADARNLAVGRATDATAPAASAPINPVTPITPITPVAQPAAQPASAPASAAAAAPIPATATVAVAPDAGASAAKPAVSAASLAALAKPEEAKAAGAPKLAVVPSARVKARPAVSAPAAAKTVPASPRTAATGRFIVNVGLFADENNARNAFTRLMDADLPANSKAIQARQGPRTRVWVGPFETQTEADAAAGKIRSFGLDALAAPE